MADEHKFNFSEDEVQKNKDKAVAESKQEVKKDAKGLWKSSTQFLKELLDFRDDTDRDATMEAIKNDIPFKGATAWILICSIFVASIGLNANSPAVVIGAMLISPLMGPILGIGLSIAINDIDTLRRSLINLATMLVLSLLTAFLFFYFFPLSEDTSELLGRTRPDIRDVLIAFFGGSALIIARTKRGTIASVIFGVAIATALMPPLCTAGYGLAKQNWEYFFGAMYLFSINTIFIALATFIILKILRFPMIKYANSQRRRLISRLAMLTAIIVMIPATWTFINVLQESKYERDYKNFIENEIQTNDNLWLQREALDIENKQLKLYFNGEVSDATISDLNNELTGYENLEGFALVINANKTRNADRLSESLDRAYDDLDEQDNIISGLQNEITLLKEEVNKLNAQRESRENVKVSFSGIVKEAKSRYNQLDYFSYAEILGSSDFTRIDTVALATVRWTKSVADSVKIAQERDLSTWLKTIVKKDSVEVKRLD